MEPLRERMIAELKLKGRAENTHRAYIEGVAKFAAYYNKSPDQLGKDEVRRYLLYLIEEKHLAEGSVINAY